MTKRRYVYELIDSRDGSVFYVGKGTGDRVKQHEKDAEKGQTGPKCDRIREIWENKGHVRSRIVSRHADDIGAYAAEAEHVSRIGRENLTNLRDGGFGGRFKSQREQMLEDAALLFGVLKKWAMMGKPTLLDVGPGVVNIADIMNGYVLKIQEMLPKVGSKDMIALSKKSGVTLEIQSKVGGSRRFEAQNG